MIVDAVVLDAVRRLDGEVNLVIGYSSEKPGCPNANDHPQRTLMNNQPSFLK